MDKIKIVSVKVHNKYYLYKSNIYYSYKYDSM